MRIILIVFLMALPFGAKAQSVWMVTNTNDSGTGSLRAMADSCIAGDTIRFNPNLIAHGTDSIVLSSGDIAFGNMGVVIKGLYNSTDTLIISGGDTSRIFSFLGSGKVVLDSLVLRNGNGVGTGLGSGGAVASWQGTDTLFVLNSSISNNYGGTGGAVRSNSVLVAYNSEFNYNAGSFGGALSSSKEIIVKNSKFKGNTSAQGGGVFTFLSIKVENSNFIRNSATMKGGAIYSLSKVSIENSVVNNNISVEGGGIFSPQIWMDSTDCNYNEGGGLFADDSIQIMASNIVGNYKSATVQVWIGGGVCLKSSSTNPGWLKISSSTIKYNLDYGGVYFEGDLCEIENSHIDSNSAPSREGGGMMVKVDSIRVFNSSFKGNQSMHSGGGFALYGKSQMLRAELDSVIVSGNSSSENGGGLFLEAWVSSSATLKIHNSVFLNNVSWKSGGGFFTEVDKFSVVEVNNTTIHGNEANLSGGGMLVLCQGSYVPNKVNVNIHESTITHNKSITGSAGGVYCATHASGNNSSNLYISSSTIAYNSAQLKGGGVFYKDTLNVINSTIYKNSANYNGGGGLYSFGFHFTSKSVLNATNSIIAVNTNGDIRNQHNFLLNSGGYNVFSDTALMNTDSTDFVGVDSAALNLSSLGNFGGDTKTMIPYYPSVAFESGNPSDSSKAQNMDVFGVREIGAGESCASMHKMVVQACESYDWNGVTYTSDTDSAYHTLVNSLGCDSIIELDLTIKRNSFGEDIIYSCDPITWIDGLVYDADNDTATFAIPNAQGCDSIVTLDFKLLEVDTMVIRSQLTLNANTLNAQYQWIDCDNGVLIGETNRSYTVTKNGRYQVEVTKFGCVDSSECFEITNVGMDELLSSSQIRIYPNPVHDQVNIEITDWPTNGVTVVVRDVSGKVVHQQEIEPISNREIVTIQTSKWAKGAYFIEVSADENRVVEQIVVQ